jgi:transposase InsO family protein
MKAEYWVNDPVAISGVGIAVAYRNDCVFFGLWQVIRSKRLEGPPWSNIVMRARQKASDRAGCHAAWRRLPLKCFIDARPIEEEIRDLVRSAIVKMTDEDVCYVTIPNSDPVLGFKRDDLPLMQSGPVTRTVIELGFEFYRVAFRRRIYRSIEELQADLDDWIREYNEERPHQGRWCFGKTPMQTFLDAKPLAKEKMIAA